MILVDLLVLVPIAAAVLAAFSGSRARVTALLGALATLGVALALIPSDVTSGGGVQGVIASESSSALWALRIDGLSAPLVGLTAVLAVAAVLASWKVSDRPAAHHALLLTLVAAVMGVFLAEDLVLFYVFWEAVLIPMYFLIGTWGHEHRRHAAMKFFLYTFAGSALMLVGLIVAVLSTQSTRLVDVAAAGGVPEYAYWLLLAGMLVKIPVVPLHTWLPDAHVEAPTAGSMLLAGVLLKMGGYGLLRFAIPLQPSAYESSRVLLAALGIVGIAYGAAMALAQEDLKRLVAYSSVSHMGFVVLAVASGSQGALIAAVLVMVSHGFVSALLFMLVGSLYERTHTREVSRLGGFGTILPAWSVAFTFGALASLGLPGLSGFPGEFVSILEGFRAWEWWVVPAAAGVVLAAAYNLRAVRVVVHGAASSEWDGSADLTPVEWVVVSILGAAIVVLGVWPGLVGDSAHAAVGALAAVLGGGG